MIVPEINAVTQAEQPIYFIGNTAFNIDQGRIYLNIDGIASDRFADNISGTLNLELWALPQRYNGSLDQGEQLAATSIGELFGQCYLENCQYDLIFVEPSMGEWNLVLLVREWDLDDFVTRDVVQFDLPYVVAGESIVADDSAAAVGQVIEVAFGEPREAAVAEDADVEKEADVVKEAVVANVVEEKEAALAEKTAADKTATEKAATEKAATEKAAAEKATAEKATAEKAAAEKAATEKAAAEKAAAEKAAAEKAAAEKAAAEKAAAEKAAADKVAALKKKLVRVNINTATEAELAAVGGISKKLAQSLVAERPFKTMDELVTVKGMGVRTLKKIELLVSL
ncbi:ComEA family DNA-binding protein [Oceanobacter antarcticus]|uniref:Helix-hairpin-helix domain-containing protein n=1 Tax=Oceanobacter antarcticus TaxID=3133425 RepID=A0ABW8NIZ0_9GAMM